MWYCRKHYQRARYRVDSWPFKQCDILQETLNRMDRWKGVASFTLTLRKREHIRSPSTETSAASVNRTRRSTSIQSQQSSSQGARRTKRSPNMSTPVPAWLRDEAGDKQVVQRDPRHHQANTGVHPGRTRRQQPCCPFRISRSCPRLSLNLSTNQQATRPTQTTTPTHSEIAIRSQLDEPPASAEEEQ